jgi:hypothetical protein
MFKPVENIMLKSPVSKEKKSYTTAFFEETLNELEELAKITGCSPACLIRHAINKLLKEQQL